MAQSQVFRGTARAIVTNDDGSTSYVYHRTAVARAYRDGSIKLDSGGYRTNTTKTAMNQASNQARLGFQVSQRDYAWFVTFHDVEVPFVDGMVLRAKTIAA